jgi:hypothetical protein
MRQAKSTSKASKPPRAREQLNAQRLACRCRASRACVFNCELASQAAITLPRRDDAPSARKAKPACRHTPPRTVPRRRACVVPVAPRVVPARRPRASPRVSPNALSAVALALRSCRPTPPAESSTRLARDASRCNSAGGVVPTRVANGTPTAVGAPRPAPAGRLGCPGGAAREREHARPSRAVLAGGSPIPRLLVVI